MWKVTGPAPEIQSTRSPGPGQIPMPSQKSRVSSNSPESPLRNPASNNNNSNDSFDDSDSININSNSQSEYDSVGKNGDMEYLLSSISTSETEKPTQQSLESNLILAAQIGQKLLEKNNILAQQLAVEQNAKAELAVQLQDLKILVAREQNFQLQPENGQIRDLQKNISNNYETDKFRIRMENLNHSQLQLEKILQMTNKEFSSTTGERHVLQLTVQEGEKALLSKQLSTELKNIKNISSKDSSIINELTQAIKLILQQEETTTFTHIQEQHTIETETLQAIIKNVESEKQEFLEIISRQQDTIKSIEEDIQNLEARLADKDRTALTRSLGAHSTTNNKEFQSLRSSLSNANMNSANANNDLLDGIFSFLQQGKAYSFMVEKEIGTADCQISQISNELESFASNFLEDKIFAKHNDEGKKSAFVSNFTRSQSSRFVSAESMWQSVKKLDHAADISSTHDPLLYTQVIKDENKRLTSDIETQRRLLSEKNTLVENLQGQLEKAKIELVEVRNTSLSAIVGNLEEQLHKEQETRNEIEQALGLARQDLLKATSKIAECECEILEKMDEVIQIRLKMAENNGLSKILSSSNHNEVSSVLKENAKLIQGNLSLGSQLSKLTTEFAQNMWAMRDTATERDKLKAKLMEMEIQYLSLKNKELKDRAETQTRDWATQTTSADNSDSSESHKDILEDMDLEIKTQQKLIDVLKTELEAAKQIIAESNTDTHTLRSKLSGMRQEYDAMHSSIDQFLSGTLDSIDDDNPSVYKVALFEARKMNVQLTEKLKEFEKTNAGQKETIFNIGSQLAQQSVKIGDIEWKLKQKEDEREAAVKRVKVMETEKDAIAEKLEEAEKEIRALHNSTSDESFCEKINNRVENLKIKKNEAAERIETAGKEIEGLNNDISLLNNKSKRAENLIAESAKLLEEKSYQNELSEAKVIELQAEIIKLTKIIESKQSGSRNSSINTEFRAVSVNAIPVIQIESPDNEAFILEGGIDCEGCSKLVNQLNSLMSRLEMEMSKTKTALQARFAAEQEKTSLSNQLIDAQKKLNMSADEIEFIKAQTELKLKSFNEMKKLINNDKDMSRSRISFNNGPMPQVPIIIASSKQSVDLSSTELLATHLSRATNIELQLEAAVREVESLKEMHRKVELKLSVAQDEVKELKANDRRNESLLSSQMQERSELAAKIAQQQKEIANHIIAKSSLEAELIVKNNPSVQERSRGLSMFRTSNANGNSNRKLSSPISAFRKSRAKSAQAPGAPVANDANIQPPVEARIIEERDRLAAELTERTTQISSLTKEVFELALQLSNVKQEVKDYAEKNCSLARAHSEEVKGLVMSHNELEECLQSQIQELTDQLMEPKSFQELSIERSIAIKSKSEDASPVSATSTVSIQPAKSDKSKIRQLRINLKESQVQVDTLRSKVEFLENEITTLQTKHKVENFVNGYVIDFAQTVLEQKRHGRNSVTATSNDGSDCKGVNADLSLQITELNAEIKRLKFSTMDDLQAKLADTKQKNASEVKALTEKIKDATKNQCHECKKLQETISALTIELEEFQTQYEKVQADLADAELQKMELEADLKVATAAANGENTAAEQPKPYSQISKSASTSCQKCNQLEAQVSSLKNELELYMKDVARSRAALSKPEAENNSNNNSSRLRADLFAVQNELAVEKEAMATLKSELAENAIKFFALQESHDQQESVIAEMKAEIAMANERTKDQIRDSVIKVTSLKTSVADLESIISQQESKIEQLHQEISNKFATTAANTMAAAAVTNHEESINQERIAQETKLEKIRAKAFKAKEEQIASLETELEGLRGANEALQSTASTATAQLDKAKHRIEELIKLSVVRTTKLKGKEEWAMELESEVSRLRTELHFLKAAAGGSAGGGKSAGDVSVSTVSTADKDVRNSGNTDGSSNVEAELSLAKSRIDELIRLSLVRANNLKGKEDRIINLEADLAAAQQDNEVVLAQEKTDAAHKIAALTTALKQREDEILDLRNTLVKLKETISQIKHDDSSKRHRDNDSVLAEKNGKIEILKTQTYELKDSVLLYEKEIGELRKQLQISRETAASAVADSSTAVTKVAKQEGELKRRQMPDNSNLKVDVAVVNASKLQASSSDTPTTAVDPNAILEKQELLQKVGQLTEISSVATINSNIVAIPQQLRNYLQRIYWMHIAITFIM
ncbi:hypothetical protein HK100_003008 [Physocladia obscura]|uniref:Uncharacterized protein n=1 Tax=Physocladia obscura TaxID=109957 RepID=A0AAD5T710_9FUNG|nr:hypothetical protein HK100_003008 [Physocladia obscura]